MVYEFEAGVLLCGQIRDFLEECRFKGMDIQWREGKGWFERTWVIKGNDEHVRQVVRALHKWSIENKLA